MEAVLFVGAGTKAPALDWLKSLFAPDAFPPASAAHLLAGTPAEGGPDEGAIVCVCFQVGAKRIEAAAAEDAAASKRSAAGWAPAPTAAPAFPRSGA